MARMSACFPPSRSPGHGFGDHEARNIEVPLLPGTRLRAAGQHDAMAVVLGAIAIAMGGSAGAGLGRAKLVGW
jgi:hypothetical protein